MEKINAMLLHSFHLLTAFLLSSKRHSEEYKRFLEKKVSRLEGKIREALVGQLAEAVSWIDLLEELVALWIRVGRKVGVAVERMRMGKEYARDEVLRLTASLEKVYLKAEESCLEQLGRGVYLKIMADARKFLENPQTLKEERLGEVIDEVEEIYCALEDAAKEKEKLKMEV